MISATPTVSRELFIRDRKRQSLTPVVMALVAAAYRSLDHDRNAARESLKRATDLLEASHREDLEDEVNLPARSGLAGWQMLRVTAHIEANIDRIVPVGELAAIVKLSPSYFSRSFKKTTGTTVCTYAMEKRIDAVKVAMLTTNGSLCDIAAGHGFADQAHLSRVFRKVVGATPNRWRRLRRMAGAKS
jgi:AraC family transcriptional regulator